MKLYIITGQTATGKTSLALELAQKHNGELINCDSRQIYKHLDIITGKDFNGKFNLAKRINNFDVGYYKTESTLHGSTGNKSKINETMKQWSNIKLWLYDVASPDEYFSSYDFVKLTIPIIKKILSEGKTPIIIGGTYLYLKHLLYGVETENIPPDWNLRKSLENKSVIELQKILAKYSTQLINQLSQSEINNPQRLIRKIEILSFRAKRQNIQPLELNIKQQSSKLAKKNIINKKLGIKNLQLEFIGLKFKEKENLRKSIEKRVGERLKQGAIEEVKKLLKMGFAVSDPGLKTIGYQQLISHLTGVISLPEALKIWINKEVQYAKRQYTFMKKDKNITWRMI